MATAAVTPTVSLTSPDRTLALVPPQPGAGKAGTGKLKRQLGLFGLLAISLGSMLGSKWLLVPGMAAGSAGPAALLSWLLAGAMLVLIALMYAELGAAYPLSFLSFGPVAGFAAGWVSWLQAATIAPIEVEVALQLLAPKWPGIWDPATHLLTGKGTGFAILFVVFFTLLNLAGARWTSGLNQLCTYWKVLVPLTVVGALAASSFHTANFQPLSSDFPFGFQGIFQAVPGGAVFALLGFEQATQFAGEARDPEGDIPRAVVISLVVGVIVYLCLQAAFIGVLGPGGIAGVAAGHSVVGLAAYGPYAVTAGALGLGWVAVLIYADAVVSPAGQGMLYLSATSRVTYSMGKAATLPKVFERVDRRGAPWFSVLLASAFGVVVLLPLRSWQDLLELIAGATAFMYAFAPVSLAALRRSDPDRARPFQLALPEVFAPLAFVAANLIIYWTGWPALWRVEAGTGIGMLVLAITHVTTTKASRPRLQLRASAWVVPWLGGLLVLDGIGPAYVRSVRHVVPFWWDLLAVALFSLGIFYLAQLLALPARDVAANIAAAGAGPPDEDISEGVGQ